MIQEVQVDPGQVELLLHPTGATFYYVPDGYVVARCPACPCCGVAALVTVLPRDLREYHAGSHVQDVWPQASAEWRELVITGTHPECWDRMFGGEDKP